MTPVRRAIWFIESHLGETIALDDVAASASLSRFHLARLFEVTTGRSVMRYVRARRLSLAARSLANGARDILSVALDAGYGSHEAFTRAFRDQFGVTPETVRARGHVDDLALVEPLPMNDTDLTAVTYEPPRIEQGRPMLIAGLAARYRVDDTAGIPQQWQGFLQHFGHLPGQVERVAYGLIWNNDEDGHFDYLTGAEVQSTADLPAEFRSLRLAAQRYAVVTHRGHIAGIAGTMRAIWSHVLPESGLQAVEAPMFERYGEEFDPRTGLGGFEIWVPIK